VRAGMPSFMSSGIRSFFTTLYRNSGRKYMDQLQSSSICPTNTEEPPRSTKSIRPSDGRGLRLFIDIVGNPRDFKIIIIYIFLELIYNKKIRVS
jgi:hypothetical protein